MNVDLNSVRLYRLRVFRPMSSPSSEDRYLGFRVENGESSLLPNAGTYLTNYPTS